MQKHSFYFWDFIVLKVSIGLNEWSSWLIGMTQVEDMTFQLPKYRFAEESDEFMTMVASSGADRAIELDVALGDFESFLKAFLPR
jgi:hypothetical protein